MCCGNKVRVNRTNSGAKRPVITKKTKKVIVRKKT